MKIPHLFHVEATVSSDMDGNRKAAHETLTKDFYAHDMDFTVIKGCLTARVEDSVEVDLSLIDSTKDFLIQLRELWSLAEKTFKQTHSAYDIYQLQVSVTDSEL